MQNEISKEESLLQDIFLKRICENTNCGSQRCDCSPVWVNGCKLYQEFKEDIIAFIQGEYTI